MLVETNLVPSKERRVLLAYEVALVPPFRMGREPVTFVVKSIEPASIEFVMAEAPIVKAPPALERPEPNKLLKEELLIIKFVVEAVAKEE